MTIAKPRARVGANETSFVAGAPDARTKRWQRGNKTQITLSISPELLDLLDLRAKQHHVSRAAMVAIMLHDKLVEGKT
jgi:hypothetical protein